MASINYAAREINVKIVYYGPGLSGKTTNLQVIHRKVPPEFKSDMVSLATETDRTLFFDFLPLDLGKIKGFSTKFQLYTVPGQVYYNATRKLVLRGVDGIVFVADSGQDKIDENLESFQNLEENLAEYGYKRENIPTIIQYNKRDLPNALSIEVLQQHINRYNLPWSEAVANKGVGVFDSLKLIGKIVIDYLNKKYSRGGGAGNQRTVKNPSVDQQNRQPSIQPNQQDYRAADYGNNRNYQAPPGQPPRQQSPYMNNQQVQQQPIPPIRPQYQGNTSPQQLRSVYTPQKPQQPFIPQQSNRSPNYQPSGKNQYIPSNESAMPASQPQYIQQPDNYPQNIQPSYPQNNTYQADDVSFEITSPPPSNASQPVRRSIDTPAKEDLYNYGSITLEPLDQHYSGTPQPQQQYNQTYDEGHYIAEQPDYSASGKTDLDLEIERYQREIEEKQRRTGNEGSPNYSPQQNSIRQPAEQPLQNADYDVYNVNSSPSFGGTPPQQRNPVPNRGENQEEQMFFPSVDKERHNKKQIRRTQNPSDSSPIPQQDKGFLSKFFKKDMS